MPEMSAAKKDRAMRFQQPMRDERYEQANALDLQVEWIMH